MPLLRRPSFGLRSITRRGCQYTTRSTPVTIGVRREDPGRVWERRAPLTPDSVAELVARDGVRVLVQDCDRRVFPIDEYTRAGAEVHPTLEPAHIVLGIKEPPLSTLLTSPVTLRPDSLVPRTNLMFSHTIKGQDYNMPLLSRFLKRGDTYADPGVAKGTPGLEATLIDYELLTDAEGKRTVAFGWHAGVAGTLEALAAMAHTYLERGFASAFLYTPRPHTSPYLDSHRAQLRYIGNQIAEHGTPRALGPCVFGVTGNGNVTKGILSILSELPIVQAEPEELPNLINNPDADLHKIYMVHALPKSYIYRKDGKPYNRIDYYANPDAHQSEFHTKIAPYISLLLNGAGWAPGFPRLLTTAQLALAPRLVAVGDISCDIDGGLEFVTRSTTIDSPSYDVNGVTVVAVDILPASLPRDASEAFAEKVLPYVRAVVKGYTGQDEKSDVVEAVKRASVASGGKVREGFEWLEEKVAAWRVSQDLAMSSEQGKQTLAPGKNKVLLLGSGMVAGPTVDELAARADVELVVASNSLEEAENLIRRHSNAKALLIDMEDRVRVEELVRQADLVVSLLPAPFHPSVAEICIKHRKHMVTASYISPAMQSLHSRAQSADVLLLNEIGLDPGIDHCSAHSLLSRLRSDNKEVVSFTSFCGGLPAPDAADVPLGYKFSWSPRGVLRAAGEGAKFRLNGQRWDIAGENILLNRFPDVPLSNVLKLEGLANRDSFPYIDTYSLKDAKLRTMLRGTLRYPGFAALMHSFKSVGLLEPTRTIKLDDWTSLTRLALEQQLGAPVPSDIASLTSALTSILPSSQVAPLLDALSWLSLIPPSRTPSSTTGPAISSLSIPKHPLPPADLLALHLAHTLRYQPDERDLVILHHEIIARTSQNTEEVHTSTLTVYGDAHASAMARTVGLPVAFAVLRVLGGGVRARGVCGPTVEEGVWKGVLDGLESKGLGVKEAVKTGVGMEGVLAEGLRRSTHEPVA
ncbi:hypothetical protein BV25DRAFT_1919690 [Artomyces pyxidatus]|uniref:Uncharacterized protein n=1 Tax=Artomyces pyxidatus TaxID=48021 RepID=A0ACB8SND9_9AGAM|nr:hypothetical protein BV25DRAFT_1919690 [Artomyces pyxidatus]